MYIQHVLESKRWVVAEAEAEADADLAHVYSLNRQTMGTNIHNMYGMEFQFTLPFFYLSMFLKYNKNMLRMLCCYETGKKEYKYGIKRRVILPMVISDRYIASRIEQYRECDQRLSRQDMLFLGDARLCDGCRPRCCCSPHWITFSHRNWNIPAWLKTLLWMLVTQGLLEWEILNRSHPRQQPATENTPRSQSQMSSASLPPNCYETFNDDTKHLVLGRTYMFKLK